MNCVVRAVCGGETGFGVCPDFAISSDPPPDVSRELVCIVQVKPEGFWFPGP